ncbi:MAG: riboflavin kinase [Patescibacteria group bacterium]|nr:riboflavin kinase [Patescibacteria group bacterium]
MIFSSKQIKGQGRGHKIGFPTINLTIPDDLLLDEGIYAVWIDINNKTYKGALHYGPIPTFSQKDKTLEVYLLDVTDIDVPDTQDISIEVDVVSYLRDIQEFANTEDLALQIDADIKKVRSILK